jgi:hypothetical protein
MKLLVMLSMLFATMAFTPADKYPVTVKSQNNHGPNLDFDLVNKTGYTIKDIYVAPTTERNWGDNIMGRQLLHDGETVEISFEAGETAHLWDIYVTWDGYESSEDVYWIGLDLSEISEISLFYNEKTGKTWAKTK